MKVRILSGIDGTFFLYLFSYFPFVHRGLFGFMGYPLSFVDGIVDWDQGEFGNRRRGDHYDGDVLQ